MANPVRKTNVILINNIFSLWNDLERPLSRVIADMLKNSQSVRRKGYTVNTKSIGIQTIKHHLVGNSATNVGHSVMNTVGTNDYPHFRAGFMVNSHNDPYQILDDIEIELSNTENRSDDVSKDLSLILKIYMEDPPKFATTLKEYLQSIFHTNTIANKGNDDIMIITLDKRLGFLLYHIVLMAFNGELADTIRSRQHYFYTLGVVDYNDSRNLAEQAMLCANMAKLSNGIEPFAGSYLSPFEVKDHAISSSSLSELCSIAKTNFVIDMSEKEINANFFYDDYYAMFVREVEKVKGQLVKSLAL